MPNNNKIHMTDKINILCFGPQCMYRYFPEDTAYTVLFGGMVFINSWNVIKTISSVLKKIDILCFETHLKILCLHTYFSAPFRLHSLPVMARRNTGPLFSAISLAVCPSSLMAAKSAPWRTRNRATSACPPCTALCRGLQSPALQLFTSAPRSSNKRVAFRWPFHAA